jgi:hypothetical protein
MPNCDRNRNLKSWSVRHGRKSIEKKNNKFKPKALQKKKSTFGHSHLKSNTRMVTK